MLLSVYYLPPPCHYGEVGHAFVGVWWREEALLAHTTTAQAATVTSTKHSGRAGPWTMLVLATARLVLKELQCASCIKAHTDLQQVPEAAYIYGIMGSNRLFNRAAWKRLQSCGVIHVLRRS